MYGTTTGGGSCGCGTVFSITPSGSEALIYSFAVTPDAQNPDAAVINVNGALYGTTVAVGVNNEGTVYKLTL